MLDNTELIETLEETKSKATEVTEKLKLAAVTAVDIDKLRDGCVGDRNISVLYYTIRNNILRFDSTYSRYRPAARRGAILFFVLSEMAIINNMYQFSLASFLDVFDFSLRKSLPDSILNKRLKNIIDTLTHNIYNYACTGQYIFHILSYLRKIDKLFAGCQHFYCFHLHRLKNQNFSKQRTMSTDMTLSSKIYQYHFLTYLC